jgi:hypothetical protein
VAVAVRVAALVSAVTLVGACATSKIIPAYKADVDRVIAAYPSTGKKIPAATTLEGQPWKVGQWVLYEHRGKTGVVGYEKKPPSLT